MIPVGSLDSEKIDEAVLPYVFRLAFIGYIFGVQIMEAINQQVVTKYTKHMRSRKFPFYESCKIYTVNYCKRLLCFLTKCALTKQKPLVTV